MKKKSARQTFVDRVTDKGGDFIAHRVMVKPGIDKARGHESDERREQLIRNRESRLNDKMMGY